MASNDNMIAALLRERATYVTQGKTDRVRQVDQQLEYHGYEPEADQEKEPQGRSEPPQQTADTGRPAAKKTAAKKTAAPPKEATAPAETPAPSSAE